MKALKKLISVLLCIIIAVFSSFAGAGSYTEVTYSHDARFASGYDYVNVIDVSDHNGSVNWAKVYADGIHEVILRVGYRGYTKGGIYPDDKFETNYAGAIAAGLKVGVYFYAQAISMTEAKAEADFVINAIKGKNISLPVIYDCEYAESDNSYVGRLYDAKLSKFVQTNICLEFLSTIKEAGYQAMLYANKFMLEDKLYASSIDSSYPIWLAQYKTKPDYAGKYEMWQYTSSGRVDGISGKVDMNFRYVKKAEVKKIEVSALKTEITAGETLQASAKTNSAAIAELGTAGAVSWKSSAPEVATVDANGLITAVAAGNAEIIASVSVTSSNGTVFVFSDRFGLKVNAVQPVDPTPTDPTPTDPTPTDPTPVDPEPTEPDIPDDPAAEDDIFTTILNMLTNFIVWLINAFGNLVSAM